MYIKKCCCVGLCLFGTLSYIYLISLEILTDSQLHSNNYCVKHYKNDQYYYTPLSVCVIVSNITNFYHIVFCAQPVFLQNYVVRKLMFQLLPVCVFPVLPMLATKLMNNYSLVTNHQYEYFTVCGAIIFIFLQTYYIVITPCVLHNFFFITWIISVIIVLFSFISLQVILSDKSLKHRSAVPGNR